MVEVLAIEGSQKTRRFAGIDALPYIDPLSDEDKAKAEKLIDEEMARMRREGITPEQFTSHLPPIDSYLRFKVLKIPMLQVYQLAQLLAPLSYAFRNAAGLSHHARRDEAHGGRREDAATGHH
jgi:hypothetical protein